jgi:hypothetical protein
MRARARTPASRSLEARTAEHLAKAENPSAYAEDWAAHGERYRAGLVRYWQREAAMSQEEADVLRGLLEEVLHR